MEGSKAWPLFFHATHLLLAILTVVGLHVTGIMWDFKMSKEGMEIWEKLAGPYKKAAEDNFNAPWRQWTGMMWAVIVGLLGIVALAVLIACVVLTLPKRLIKWYYLAAAILVLLIACLGLGYNASTVEHSRCRKRCEKISSKKDCKKGCLDFPSGMVGYMLIAAISFIHAILYLAAFFEALVDQDASTESSPFGPAPVAPTGHEHGHGHGQPPPPSSKPSDAPKGQPGQGQAQAQAQGQPPKASGSSHSASAAQTGPGQPPPPPEQSGQGRPSQSHHHGQHHKGHGHHREKH